MSLLTSFDDLIGNTPLLKLKKLFPNSEIPQVFAKLECVNPSSIKDRPGLCMIQEAMKQGKLSKDVEIVEASSGNTAISLAALGAHYDFPVTIFMHEGCSIERRKILNAFGAKVVLTPSSELTAGARTRAIQYCENNPEKAFFLNQHSNPFNAMAHIKGTGPELWNQFGENLHTVIIGMGTCGTIEGISEYLKEKNPNIRIVGFEPESNACFSGGPKGSHKIIGIGPGFKTDNFKRTTERIDEIMLVSDDIALEYTRKIPKVEGLLVGVTSGASVWVAEQLLQRPEYSELDSSKAIIVIFCDSGERYLSTPDLFPTDNIDYSYLSSQ